MNLLLLRPEEVVGNLVTLNDRRSKHIIHVLGATPGEFLRTGIENTGTTMSEVISLSGDVVTLRVEEPTKRPRPTTTLIIAVPRPKVVSRVIAAAASFGLARLIFVNAWRVEKSYYSSPRLKAERIEEDLRLGCEQGAQCWVPSWEIWPRFTQLLERSESCTSETSPRVVLHPGGQGSLADVLFAPGLPPQAPLTLLVGPEGGWITREHESLVNAGYATADLGTGPLKTEVAVAAALGQLALIRSFPSSVARAKLSE